MSGTQIDVGESSRLTAVAANKGISGSNFSPNSTCTRGQIVTFLYRDLG